MSCHASGEDCASELVGEGEQRASILVRRRLHVEGAFGIGARTAHVDDGVAAVLRLQYDAAQ